MTAWLLAFPVPFLLFIAGTYPASRYLIPLVPFLAVFAAVAVSWIAQRRTDRGDRCVACLARARCRVRDSLRTDLFIRQTDTRTLAAAFIDAHVPDGRDDPDPAVFGAARRRPPSVAARSGRAIGPADADQDAAARSTRRPYPAPAYRLIYLGYGRDVDKLYLPYDQLDGGDPARPRAARTRGVRRPEAVQYRGSSAWCRSSRPWPARAGGWPCFRRTGTRSGARARAFPAQHRCPDRRALERPVRSWRSGKSMALVRKLRDRLATEARALPIARHAWARYRRRTLRGAHPAVPRRRHRPRRPPADGRGLRSDDAVQPALRVLLRRRPAEHRRRVAAGAAARRAAQAFPDAGRLPDQPDRRRDLHAQGHHVRAGSLPREGLRLRLPDDQRHDHHRGARRSARRPRGARVPEAHQRLDRRPEASCTTPRAA